jgi:antitoxin component of MazEF toxin-antitoxin module
MPRYKIAKTWISGQRSATLIIARSLAEEYGLTQPSHVVLEKRNDGILIRKLKVEERETER